MRLLATTLTCILSWQVLSAQQAIRKVYLTGGKQHAIHAGKGMLHLYTCLEAVDDPLQADAIVDLEVGTIRPIEHLPQPEPDGFVTCTSGYHAVSCSELGGLTYVTTCSGRGASTSCSTYSYDPIATLDAVRTALGQGRVALDRRMLTHAYLVDKSGRELLWEYDEGVEHKGVGAWHSMWWDQLNTYVGCGKTRLHYKTRRGE